MKQNPKRQFTIDESLRVTFDEMAEMFHADYPYLYPNNRAVGGYARRNGYTRVTQQNDKKVSCFYVKCEYVKR